MAMKVFKYKFTRLTYILIYAGLALCVAGVGLNIFSVIKADIAAEQYPVYPIIQYTLMFLIPTVLSVLLISLLFSSYYSIDGKTFKTSFGIIKSKYDINDIETVLLDKTVNKLSVFFKNGSFIVIVVKEEWYEEFIDALCAANDKIEYSIKSKESDGSDEDKKSK